MPASRTGTRRWPDDVYRDARLLPARRTSTSTPSRARLSSPRSSWAFTLFLADFFDTMGTLVGVGKQAGYLDERGRAAGDPQAAARRLARRRGRRRGLGVVRDDVHRVGVRRRRRRAHRLGRASSPGALFFPFMFFAPIIGMVPPQATAPALIIVGLLMMTVLTEVEEEADAGVARRPRAKTGRYRLHRSRGIGLARAR